MVEKTREKPRKIQTKVVKEVKKSTPKQKENVVRSKAPLPKKDVSLKKQPPKMINKQPKRKIPPPEGLIIMYF